MPQDLLLIGYDDIYTAALTSPALTTLRLDPRSTATQLIDACLKLYKKEESSFVIQSHPELIVRESA